MHLTVRRSLAASAVLALTAVPTAVHADPGQAPAGHNPPGNNGTVKIAGPGDAAGHPSNSPHPGCTFSVEWYGFDEGGDVVSSVTFAPQAPTADVTISPATDTVPVGEDAAGGGTDLDGREQYTLSFEGEPHPQQGYHVKLTVETPYSHGNDTKSKVFWVEPCEADAPVAGEDADSGQPGVPGGSDTDTGTTTSDTGESTVEESEEQAVAEEAAAEVLGIEQFAAEADEVGKDDAAPVAARAAGGPTAAEVPTAVDSGLFAGGDWTGSSLPLALMGLGAAAALGGVAYRRRTVTR